MFEFESSKNTILSRFKSISRISAWRAVFFTDMHACFIAIFYMLLVTQILSYDLLWRVLALITSLGLYIVYGFLVNDFFDMPTDRLAGKHREIHNMPRMQVVSLILLLVLSGYVVTLSLINQLLYALIYIIAYLLATLYSAPPLRFKCRGIYGIVCNVLIEKALPALLVISFFQHFTLDALFLLVLFALWQLELILVHQYADYEGDVQAKVRTFVVEIGLEKTSKLLRSLQILVALLYIVFSAIIVIQAPYSAVFFILIAIGYFLLKKIGGSFTMNSATFGLPRFYAEEDKIGEFRRSLSSFLSACFSGPFSLFAGFVLTLKLTPYIVLLMLSIASQYYLIKGHYRAILEAVFLQLRRRRSTPLE